MLGPIDSIGETPAPQSAGDNVSEGVPPARLGCVSCYHGADRRRLPVRGAVSAKRNVPHPNEIRILGIAGSLRQGSLNRGLLRAAQELAPPGMSIELFERLGELPPYNEDVEQVGKPESVEALVDAVRAADGLL
ncbi:MAG: NADPH-dependent FMN reductase, partial [Gemmatimonadales bacterium]